MSGDGWRISLVRSDEGRVVAGVCTALAGALAIDVTLVRLAMIVLALGKGLGVVVYLALWLLLPPEGEGARPFRHTLKANAFHIVTRGREVAEDALVGWGEGRRRGERWPAPFSRRWLALGLVGGGGLVLMYSLGLFSWLGPVRGLGVAAIALGGAVFVAEARGG